MPLLRYDPNKHIDSEAWLALDESEQTWQVARYHRRHRIRLPNETIHAAIHVVVENQVALGDEFPAKNVLLRLMTEGLNRHEAIHAIGSVLSQALFTAMNEPSANRDLGGDYIEKLKTLSAESWRQLAG